MPPTTGLQAYLTCGILAESRIPPWSRWYKDFEMTETFDPYHRWLGISPKDQPPNHYRLLSIDLFESNPDVIEAAADKQMSHVRTYQTGQHSQLSQRVLNEISAARVCLLNPEKKAEYDESLRAAAMPVVAPVATTTPVVTPAPVPTPTPVATPTPVRRSSSRPAWQTPHW